MNKPLRGVVVPVHAHSDQIVDIHWRLPDGRIVIQSHFASEMEHSIDRNQDQSRRTGLEG